jgi:hypothetical protein
MQPGLGELWILLRPTDSKIRITGSRPKYQQRVIFQLIEEFGFNTIIHIQPPPTGELGCIPIVQKRLEQCMHLGYDSNYLVITDTPQIMTPCEYQYNWSAGSSFCTVTFNTRRGNCSRLDGQPQVDKQG